MVIKSPSTDKGVICSMKGSRRLIDFTMKDDLPDSGAQVCIPWPCRHRPAEPRPPPLPETSGEPKTQLWA
jgi:hypothetical protein